MADMLIRGESILIPYSTNICDVQYLQNGGSYTLSLAKQYSRLATVFVSLGVADDNTDVHHKEVNRFFLSRSAKVPGAGELATYIQVGNQRWPVFDQEGTKEAFHRLIQATGTWNSTAHAVCIGADAYEGVNASDLPDGADAALLKDATHWVAGYDLESLPQAQSTGIPVQGGAQIQVNLKNVGDVIKAYVICHADAVLEIRSQGAIAYS